VGAFMTLNVKLYDVEQY